MRGHVADGKALNNQSQATEKRLSSSTLIERVAYKFMFTIMARQRLVGHGLVSVEA
jgi:hypothetical protein